MAASPFCWKRNALGRVVLALEFRGIEQDAQDLRIISRGPSRKYKEAEKHQKTAEEAAKEVEGAGAHERGDKKESALGAQDRKRLVDRAVDRIECGITCHGFTSLNVGFA
jgi:hypothetical protein